MKYANGFDWKLFNLDPLSMTHLILSFKFELQLKSVIYNFKARFPRKKLYFYGYSFIPFVISPQSIRVHYSLIVFVRAFKFSSN